MYNRKKVFVWTHVFNSLWYVPGVELLHHVIILCFTFEELPDAFPKRMHHFTFPPAVYEGSNFSISLPKFAIWLFDSSNSNGWKVVSYCCRLNICVLPLKINMLKLNLQYDCIRMQGLLGQLGHKGSALMGLVPL